MLAVLFLIGFMVMVILMKCFLGFSSRLGWMVVIWGFMVSTVGVSLSVYNGMSLVNCDFGEMLCYDEVSCSLVWLLVVVVSLALIGSLDDMMCGNMGWGFLHLVTGLAVVLVLCFTVDSMVAFYIFFECSLIPTLFIVCYWGYQPERLQAGKYMMLYMISASLPLLIYIMKLFAFYGTDSFLLFYCSNSNVQLSFLEFFMMSVAFFVKSPVYGVHLWLPKAHAEAPVGGSMVLAGVLLKLGGYGLIRFSWYLSIFGGAVFSCLICLCVLGGVFGSVVCCVQVDVKSLIAYSSIGHMSLVVSGVMCVSHLSLKGSVFLMLAHGLSSCGMFFLAKDLSKLYGSRMLFVIRGGIGSIFGVNFWLAAMCGFNAGVPLSLNFCSEVILYISLMSYSLVFGVLVGILGILSCTYSWLFYCGTQVGSYPIWAYSSSFVVSSIYVNSVVCLPIYFFFG
uniref:NADH-ubiquinone oxidoreductase chain 4 n=1 Tax=Venustaconcha ellipsiformis TaxID=301928 RepID=D2DW12_VENEL|nr:NADH dehydrogenase subunit 4 [Venustaconcha ellipsiformis]ACQ91039.1 NADH dehydrogenase subunit 4 [Venustaconcha ellipsiformis]